LGLVHPVVLLAEEHENRCERCVVDVPPPRRRDPDLVYMRDLDD